MRPDPQRPPPTRPLKRLGVLGALTRDTIRSGPAAAPHPAPPPRWGGIAYSLAALEGVLPEGWTAVPIVKVGSDLAARARSFLESLSQVGDMRFVRTAPQPNNRVELVYATPSERTEARRASPFERTEAVARATPSERTETLTGGVEGWSADEIEEVVAQLDALYVNFVAGNELTLDGARVVRDRLRGPVHADLHSLFLDLQPDGRRAPRPLPRAEAWAACFDTVQMNESEFALYQGGRAATDAPMTGRTRMIAVTLGARGVDLFDRDAHERGDGPSRRERLPVPGLPVSGDPTGCGDIWGATFLAGLLDGRNAQDAAVHASWTARLNLRWSGAEAFARRMAERRLMAGA